MRAPCDGLVLPWPPLLPWPSLLRCARDQALTWGLRTLFAKTTRIFLGCAVSVTTSVAEPALVEGSEVRSRRPLTSSRSRSCTGQYHDPKDGGQTRKREARREDNSFAGQRQRCVGQCVDKLGKPF